MITGAIYPEVAELLEIEPANQRASRIRDVALDILEDQTATFERSPSSRGYQFVSIRRYDHGIRQVVVDVELDRQVAATRPELFDRLKQLVFLKLVRMGEAGELGPIE